MTNVETYLEAAREASALARAYDEEPTEKRRGALAQARAAQKLAYARLTGSQIGQLRRLLAQASAAATERGDDVHRAGERRRARVRRRADLRRRAGVW